MLGRLKLINAFVIPGFKLAAVRGYFIAHM